MLENKMITQFQAVLEEEDRAPGTIEKYTRDVQEFLYWLRQTGEALSKQSTTAWKRSLVRSGQQPRTINSKIAAVNKWLSTMNMSEYKITPLKIQRRLFRNEDRELTKEEYERLVLTATENGQERLALLIETICCTGIRVSEIQYITVESLSAGKIDIALKGKIRTIMIPGKLRRKLLKYVKRQKIKSGVIYRTKSGKKLDRKQIWAEMKRLCQKAHVNAKKVFPHNLRHLFAKTFFKAHKDIVVLADLLGHSSIETTRIYLCTTGIEVQRKINHLGLII